MDRNEVKVKDEISLEEDLSPNGVMITEDTSKKLGYQLGDVIEGENFGNIDGDDKRDFIVEGIITNSKHISDEYKIFTSKKIMGDMFDVNTLYSVEMNIESEIWIKQKQ